MAKELTPERIEWLVRRAALSFLQEKELSYPPGTTVFHAVGKIISVAQDRISFTPTNLIMFLTEIDNHLPSIMDRLKADEQIADTEDNKDLVKRLAEELIEIIRENFPGDVT